MEVDAELLAFFVEVAAFEAEGTGDVGHVKVVAADFSEEHFAFEGFGALDQSSLPRVADDVCGSACRDIGRGQDQANVFGGNSVFAGDEDEALDDVAEFAHVAGPGILAQFGDGFVGEEFFFPAILRRYLTSKVRGKNRKIFGALAKGREEQRKNVNAVIEIAAKFIFLDGLFEVAMSGDNYADADFDGLVAADAFYFAFFEHTQEFCLHG